MAKKSSHQIIKEHREKVAAHRAEKLKNRAQFFKKWPGRGVKIVSTLVMLLCILIVVDGFLGVNWKTHEIQGHQKERYDVVSSDGMAVGATYYHVYLNKEKSFDVFMYKYEYYLASEQGEVEVGHSLIFNTPRQFSVGAGDEKETKNLEFDVWLYRVLPIVLLVFSAACTFLNFGHNEQTLMYGYINMGLMPIAMIILLRVALSDYPPGGTHTMDVKDLEIHSVEEMKNRFENFE